MAKIIRLLSLQLLAGMSLASAASSFVNGSFETPTAPLTFVNAPSGFGGWDVAIGNAMLLRSSGNRIAHGGDQYLQLPGGATQDSQIEQTLSGLFSGVDYEISYYLCKYNGSGSTRTCSLEVVLYNQKVDTLDPSVPALTNTIGTPANPWEHRTFQFTAEATTGVLSVENYRSDATFGAYLMFDDFTIRAIPKGQPTVAFGGKKPRKPISRPTYQLRGGCSAQLPIESIRVITKKRTIVLAGSTSWVAKIRLKTGRNRVTVVATDIAGTTSAPIIRTIRRAS